MFERRRLNREEQRQAHKAALHMTELAFIRAYGPNNKNIWRKMNEQHDPRETYPWRFPDAGLSITELADL